MEVLDDVDKTPKFRECIEIIDRVVNKEGKSILIQCATGVSRSASVVIAYLMHQKRISLLEAFHMVREKRPCVSISPGFQRHLQAFEAELKREGLLF